MLAALTLLLVLTIYAALVAIASYGVWSHFTSDEFAGAVRRIFGDPLPYVAFCIAGPILSVFLIKPIFTDAIGGPARRDARPVGGAAAVRVRRATLRRQGAPRRARSGFDTDINASASLRHGLISLFRDDLVLTVGMPLVRTTTSARVDRGARARVRPLRPGGAMRLSYLIRTTLFFMLRIVHECDGFDEMLIELSRFRFFLDARITLVVWLFSLFMLGVQGFLWLARGLLRGLVWLGMVATGCSARDGVRRRPPRGAGRGERCLRRGRDAADRARGRGGRVPALQERWWQGGRLADDLSALIAAAEERLTARPASPRRSSSADAGNDRCFDTHRALRDRLASVAKEAEPGAFRVDSAGVGPLLRPRWAVPGGDPRDLSACDRLRILQGLDRPGRRSPPRGRGRPRGRRANGPVRARLPDRGLPRGRRAVGHHRPGRGTGAGRGPAIAGSREATHLGTGPCRGRGRPSARGGAGDMDGSVSSSP